MNQPNEDNTLDTTVDEWRAEIERLEIEAARIPKLDESRKQYEQRKLCKWLSRKCGGKITTRDLMRFRRGYRENTEKAESALIELVKAGYGKWESIPPGRNGGRGYRIFKLNPKEKQ